MPRLGMDFGKRIGMGKITVQAAVYSLALNIFRTVSRAEQKPRPVVFPKKKAAPPWMAAENLLASFFYFISVSAQMGNPPHTRGESRT